jgi:hypothetical protein
MPDDSDEPTPDATAGASGAGRRADPVDLRPGVRGPLIFGVAAATIELATVLWVLYC